MTTISFMGANLVAQQVDFAMTEGWDQGDAAANAWYAPIETFPERFGAFVDLVKNAGFTTLDVWTGQLHWAWATQAHLDAARSILDAADVAVASYAGLYGDNAEEFASACAVAVAIGAKILGGPCPLLATEREAVLAGLEANGLVLAIENHPETSPQEMLDRFQAGDRGLIGTAVDTGWWGTRGFDAADAIRQLGSHVMHVHLKDIRTVGEHETCVLGEGIVPIEDCVRAMAEIGYTGPISIEHEPEDHDPVPDCVVGLAKVVGWLKETEARTPVASARATI